MLKQSPSELETLENTGNGISAKDIAFTTNNFIKGSLNK
jgi:hypothetical protein